MTRHQEVPNYEAKIKAWSRKPDPNITYGHRYPDGSSHSLNAMADDDIDFMDLLNALRRGRVSEVQVVDEEVRYVVQGADFQNRELNFVVVLIEENEEIELITAWAN
jgi:hypothetical protein